MVLRATPQKREEKERVRRALLRAALELGAAHGFASLGLREVSRAADIAPTSFYRQFSEMPELGQALVDELVGPLLDELAKTGAENVSLGLTEGMLHAVRADPELVRFLVAERSGAFAPLRKAIASKLDVLARTLRERVLSRGRDTKEVDQASEQAASDTLVALVLDGFTRLLEESDEQRERQRERLLGSLAHVLGPYPDARRK